MAIWRRSLITVGDKGGLIVPHTPRSALGFYLLNFVFFFSIIKIQELTAAPKHLGIA